MLHLHKLFIGPSVNPHIHDVVIPADNVRAVVSCSLC